jgi:quercetin dioxygenase-like cupin family protein
MAIEHAVPGHPIDIAPFGERLSQQSTFAVFKAQDLEVMRLVLAAGKSLPPHKVPGEITIHCIEGRLEISTPTHNTVLEPGHLILLPGAEVHGVLALQDSSALVTVALKK